VFDTFIDRLLDMVMPLLMLVCVIILLLGFVATGHVIWFHLTHTCIEYQKQVVHHPGWTQFIQSGNVTVPVYHAGYDAVENVCVAYKED
jgi:hypothetical protein